jgi:hypothetical protein
VVGEAGGGGAQRAAQAVVVGIDDDDRLLGPHLDHELPRLALLLGRQCQLGLGHRPARPVDVKPGVGDAHLDQTVQPRFAQQIHVRLAQTGTDAGQQLVLQAVLQPAIVRFQTSLPPRRSSLTISLPSTLINGVMLPKRRISRASRP